MAKRKTSRKGKSRRSRKVYVVRPTRNEYAPLNSLWFISSILGIIISVGYVSKINLQWATAFTVVFIAMFIAGVLSIRRATPDEQLMPRPKKIN